MTRRISLTLDYDEWNFLTNLETIAFLGSYRSEYRVTENNLLKAIILFRERPYGKQEDKRRKLTNSIMDRDYKIITARQTDVDEETSRFKGMGYSPGRFTFSMDKDVEKAAIKVQKEMNSVYHENLSLSDAIQALVRRYSNDLAHSFSLSTEVLFSCLYNLPAYGIIQFFNTYHDIRNKASKHKVGKPEQINFAVYNYLIKFMTEVKRDLPVITHFLRESKNSSFPGTFEKYMANRDKFWSIAFPFNYVTAEASLEMGYKLLMYPTLWITDIAYGYPYKRVLFSEEIVSKMFRIILAEVMSVSLLLTRDNDRLKQFESEFYENGRFKE